MLSTEKEFPPSDLAVRCGRIVFYVVGGIVVAVPLAMAAGGILISRTIEWLVTATGVGLILLGWLLPPKVVAHAGFDLPMFLPDLPDAD